MSTLAVNTITNAAGGNTAQINGMTPTADSLQGFRNRIINGNMVIDQRNAGASVTPSTGTYTVDRWRIFASQSSKLTAQQNAGSVTPPSGYTNYLGMTSSSAYSVISSDLFLLQQFVEGFNSADLAWGTASAQSVTLSFWVRNSLTGTFGVNLQNSAGDTSYSTTYTVSSANTWEQKTITIPGPTSGTWLTTNGKGIVLSFVIGVGSAGVPPANNVWQSANYYGAVGAQSLVGTSGATFYITGVQLEAGSVATPFERRPYSTELQLCQRYAFVLAPAKENATVSGVFGFDNTRAFDGSISAFPTTMRAEPTTTLSGTWNLVDGVNSATPGSNLTFVAAGTYGYYGNIGSGGSGIVGTRYYAVRTTSTTSQVLFSAEL
jgi:hypothetical protein